VARGFKTDGHVGVAQAVAEVEAELGDTGRVVLRASGTEPLIRVMVEGRDEAQVRRTASHIADAVKVAAGV
jgi:phosphoglucosamine mutase